MIALVDCNNFYASCERVFRPNLENKPIVVLSNNDGCIIARSNEAKEIGIKMGEPAFKAKKKIEENDIRVFSSNYALYGDMSNRVMKILSSESSKIEIYSIDEAFLDFSNIASCKQKALFIREKVKKWTGIPTSVGIAKTKVLAKIANSIAKKYCKNGIFLLDGINLINRALKYFPVQDLWGIGTRLTKFLNSQGIYTAYELSKCNELWIKKNLSILGLKLVKELNGISCFPLENQISPRKNIRTSRSFSSGITKFEDLKESVSCFASNCASKLRDQKSYTKKISVFIRTNPFKLNSKHYIGLKSLDLPTATNDTLEIVKYALKSLKSIYRENYIYKKGGVILHHILPDSNLQLSIFDSINREKRKSLMSVYDSINNKMGRDTVRLSVQGQNRKWRMKQEKLSPCYTTRMSEILNVKI